MKVHHLLILIFAMAFFSFTKKHDKNGLFPDKADVLALTSSKFDNFFPIVTLDLSSKGIRDKIHIIYVSFDPSIDDSSLFPKPDYIDEFTFDILADGKLKPTFNDKALVISRDFEKYFTKAKRQYSKAKKEIKSLNGILDTPVEPQWLQYDQTPKNSKGQNYKFICELDVQDLADDDCKLYVFYDEAERKIKCVYQRT